MAKKLLALFDKDLDYVNRFMAFVKGRRNLPFKIAGLSKIDALFEFVDRNRVDILLFSEDSGMEYLKELKKISGIGETIILGEKRDAESHQKYINKYQSAEMIIEEILDSLQLEGIEKTDSENGDLEIITVYSPACDLRKQIFSLCIANAAAKNKSVLYINLERFSGLKYLIDTSKDISMSDIIYYYKTNTSKIREGLSSSALAVGNFDCLTAPLDMEDLEIIGDDNWKCFLNTVASLGGYDCVIVDLDEAVKKINAFFDFCERIYVPTISGLMAERRIEEFKDYLKLCDKEKNLEKIIEVDLGEERTDLNMSEKIASNYLQNCFMGRMQVIADRAYFKGAENGA